jgi:hypothetical protein
MQSPDPKESRFVALRSFCSVCGKPSGQTICDPCAMKIHLDALARKMHEANGAAWAKWNTPEGGHRHRH